MISLSSAFFLFYKITRFLLYGDVIFTTAIDEFYLRNTCGYSDVHVKSSKNIIFFLSLSLSLASDVAFKYVLRPFCVCLSFFFFSPWGFISMILGPSHTPCRVSLFCLQRTLYSRLFSKRGIKKGVWQFSFSIRLKLIFWMVS